MSEAGDTVEAWLSRIGLGHLAPLFLEQQIERRDLPLLTEADLLALGLPLGPRRRILHHIEEASTQPEDRPDAPRRDAERRQLTVMFIDLVGSTSLFAELDIEDMRDVIRAFQDTCAGIVTRFAGHVAKYMGDGILVYFGWPQAHEDAAERALHAALETVGAVAQIRPRPGIQLAVRVGVATGVVVVGDLIGEGGSREEAVFGDAPNLAARLQSIAAPGSVVVSESTARLVESAFDLDDLGPRAVKGLPAPVPVYAVSGERHRSSRFDARSRGTLAPMVGRRREMKRLSAAWNLAKTGAGQGVLLLGDAGVGKSRLCRALVDAVGGDNPNLIRLQCSPYHADSALWPFIECLTQAAGLASAASPALEYERLRAFCGSFGFEDAASLRLLSALLGGEDRPSETPPLAPQARRARTLDALVALVSAAAANRPLLMVVEDAQWIDPTSHELIERCLDRLSSAAAMVVLTSRPENRPRLTGRGAVSEFHLEKMERDDLLEVVSCAGGAGLPKETVEAIVSRADGVALFAEELTKTVLESGDFGIPASLHDSLMARLDRISGVKEIAQIASCIGRSFSYRLLRAVAPHDEDDLRERLERLVGSGIVFARGSPPEATYTFKHALVRDSAYQSMLKAKRQELNAGLCSVVEAEFPDIVQTQPGRIAHYCAEAGLFDRAVMHWRRAGDEALRKSANLEAMQSYRHALARLPQCTGIAADDPVEADLRLGLGIAVNVYKGWGAIEVRDELRRAAELCLASADAARQVRVLGSLWQWHLLQADYGEAAKHSAVISGLAAHCEDASLKLRSRHIAGYTKLFLGDYPSARSEFAEGLELYRPEQQDAYIAAFGEDPGLWCHAYLGWTDDWLGRRDQALRTMERGVALARKLPNLYSRCFVLGLAAHLYRSRGEADRALECAAEAETLAEQQGHAQFGAWAKVILGWALAAQGRTEEGLERALQGYEAWRSLGLRNVQWRHLVLLADIHLMSRDEEKGLACVATAEEQVGGLKLGQGIEDLHIMKGRLLSRLGRQAEAETEFGIAIRKARLHKARTFELRALTKLAELTPPPVRSRAIGTRLAELCAEFDEGRDTEDLIAAARLLETIGRPDRT